MDQAKMQDHFVAIGRHMAVNIGKDPNGAFLYSEGGDNIYLLALYHDEGDKVVCHLPSKELSDILEAFWNDWPSDKLPAAILYEIVDGQFEVEMRYPYQLDLTKEAWERSDHAINLRYRDRRISCPKPADWHELSVDDLTDWQ
ncbi:MAG: hypothetical protein IPP23_06165 [Sphingomonadales bacterium]|nr:hypothetical protein [Sphingomonadales bacterium]